jgi:hypothetical protein
LPARLLHDRLYRWTTYASLPFLWLALALLNPFLLLVPLFVYVALERAMAYGIVDRTPPPPDPDDYI